MSVTFQMMKATITATHVLKGREKLERNCHVNIATKTKAIGTYLLGTIEASGRVQQLSIIRIQKIQFECINTIPQVAEQQVITSVLF